jgi:hypothetical protein
MKPNTLLDKEWLLVLLCIAIWIVLLLETIHLWNQHVYMGSVSFGFITGMWTATTFMIFLALKK